MLAERLSMPSRRRIWAIEELGVIGALLVLCALLALSTSSFLRPDNLLDVARQASDYGIMAVGMVFLLSMGEIDLSVGAVLTLVGVITALLLQAGVPELVALPLGVVVGALCGLINGLVAVLLRIPSIIVTLGTMSIFRGLALVLSQAKPIASFPKQGTLFQLGADGLFGIPAGVLVMLLVCGVAHVALHHLPFGWRLQAIGSSPRAARFSGIAIARYRVFAMTLMGTVAGIAGVTALTFLEAADPNVGLGSELLVIASAVIGGTALTGGSGSVIGAVLGALIIAVIKNGLVHLGMSAYWGMTVTGVIIIAAVLVSTLFRRKEGSP
jgi:ribose transport system permease protein